MSFSGKVGLNINLDSTSNTDTLAALFNEELGAVIQVLESDCAETLAIFADHDLEQCVSIVAEVKTPGQIKITTKHDYQASFKRSTLRKMWSELSYKMQSLRDNPATAKEGFDSILNENDPGMEPLINFDYPIKKSKTHHKQYQPKVAVLRDQGVNSHIEMAVAFHSAGFKTYDFHMTDILDAHCSLDDFVGLVACGGFSYGDVLGAGGGWAKTILFHENARSRFEEFFAREDTFTLGICNGCQMLSQLREIIPGSGHWPKFVTNLSEQFEARLNMIEILDSKSLFFNEMAGSFLPIVTSHGEGRAQFNDDSDHKTLEDKQQTCIRYVDNFKHPASSYPENPNGSEGGLAGLCSADGRVTILMPHPERVLRTVQYSWSPADWSDNGPWLKMFQNARDWID
jgi:phosphoribosylformylglycinamidine synthase